MLKQARDQLGAGDPAGDLEVVLPAASPELAPGNIPLSSSSVFSLLGTTSLHELCCSFSKLRESLFLLLLHEVPSGFPVIVVGVG